MDTMTLFTTSATRSRRATASIVAGMTLAGAAAVGFSAPAQAATVDTWDRLAECESSGTWDINTGNGFYGGVQFTLSSWQAVGGEGYPHQASKAEQIKRAEILQDLQGWGAWPLCSQKLGLTQADADAGDVDAAPVAVERTATVQRQSAADETAADQAAAEQAAADQAAAEQAAADQAAAERWAAKQAAAEQAAAERWAAKQAAADQAAAERWAAKQAAAEQAAADKAAAQRAAAAEKAAAQKAAAAEKAAAQKAAAAEKAAAQKAAAAEKAAAQKAAAAEQAAAQKAAAAEQAVVAEAETIVVKSGDSLWKLANEYEVEGGWTALYEANKGAVSDAAVIYVGQELVLPQA
ncbi:transglycosylase family protein [Micrococcus luteus]|uniref:resuscitation-promoting factor Rpf n=1 Tax=Micrococcus luteus TaxID=1270 RepID=UPI001021AF58|nr:transglycosylase family protein [Micrococcus luteus]MCM3552301.1 transglycosylase family protein [Micrococcus luteus]MCV7481334.1 transglycosylase family protein [Micrococcus luteus]MCV7538800.1 transglycosylase family protein [Micrococcus luteus]NNM38114.1 LysM peptidoglycan-binding domain-containing protein [Micrococcus luteus]RZB22034.1 LysM peptidoglycan-binding domain-containing protein [Micrococcus luteus]